MKSGKREQSKGWRPQLTTGEKRLGWVFFALYLFCFPFLLGGAVRILDERLGLALTAAQSSLIYYLLVLAILVAAFWEFLRHAGVILRSNWRENLFALAVTLAAGLGLTVAVSLIPLPVENPVYLDYPEQLALSPAATVLVVVFLRPAVEELLYRGLLFGSLRKKHRAAAYVLTGTLFAVTTVWQYVLPQGEPAYLLLALRYLPMSFALTWCYDVGGSVVTPIAARTVLSAIFLLLAAR